MHQFIAETEATNSKPNPPSTTSGFFKLPANDVPIRNAPAIGAANEAAPLAEHPQS